MSVRGRVYLVVLDDEEQSGKILLSIIAGHIGLLFVRGEWWS